MKVSMFKSLSILVKARLLLAPQTHMPTHFMHVSYQYQSHDVDALSFQACHDDIVQDE